MQQSKNDSILSSYHCGEGFKSNITIRRAFKGTETPLVLATFEKKGELGSVAHRRPIASQNRM